jgi:UDP-glucuronate decarboxylase
MDSAPGFTGPVNLGNPSEFTVRELADEVLTFTGSRSKLQFCPLPIDDPKQRRPDIRLARSKLGWEPNTSLTEGLLSTINFFKRLRGTSPERLKLSGQGRARSACRDEAKGISES